MTDFLSIGLRNLLFWAGIGGIAVPLLCYAIRHLMSLREPAKPPVSLQKSIDQLQAIEGVGPQIALLLSQAGMGSFAAIAAKKPAEIQLVLDQAGPNYALANPASWPEQARLLAAGDIEGFLKLAIALTAGVTVLENIDGIGEAWGERLRLAGINTVAKLAQSSETELQTALSNVGIPDRNPGFSNWIAQARKFAAGDSGALSELAGNLQRATLPAAAATALSGPAETTSSSEDIGGQDSNTPWLQQNAAAVCTTILGSLLVFISTFVPPKVPTTKLVERYFEHDCVLNEETNFLEGATFNTGDVTLKVPEGVAKIDNFVAKLEDAAKKRKSRPDSIFVTGFASEEGNPLSNQRLSEQRAETIENRLQKGTGWDPALFTSAGRGETKAELCFKKPENAREACREKDRKVQVLVAYSAIDPNTAKRTCLAWREVADPPHPLR